MIKIQPFETRTQLSNRDSLSFGHEIEIIIDIKGADVFGINDVFSDYKAKLQAFNDSVIYIPKNAYTEQMKRVSQQRQSLHIAIVIEIKNYLRHFDIVRINAATHLKPLADSFLRVQKLSFDNQTNFIDNFLQTLASDEYKREVALLELGNWTDELKRVNDICEKLTLKHFKEHSGKTGKGNSRITRLAYEASYNILVEKLNALEWVDGDERHAELFTWWNARIDHYRAMTSNNLRA